MLNSALSKLSLLTSNMYQRELNSAPFVHSSILSWLVCRLLLYGMCCSLDERFAEGSEFLELATTIDEKNEVTWTIRG